MSTSDSSNETSRATSPTRPRRALAIGLALAAATAAGAAGYLLGQGKTPWALWAQHMAGPAAAAASSDAAGTREQPAESGAAPAGAKSAGSTGKRILYYRNPMGLADTSPAPKKDWMGMDYIPVYEGEEQDDGSTVKVSLDRVQRIGVRTGKVERRVLAAPVRVPGTVKLDERRIKSVTMRFDGFIEELFVNATGQAVKAGQPLFRVYSSQVQQAQVDLIVATREHKTRGGGDTDAMIQGPMQRLRNLDMPETRIREVRETGANPRTIDWPSPMSGIVLEKKVIDGQRAAMGSELYRIADLSTVWIIAEVPEQELPQIRIGDRATAEFLSLPGEERAGKVTFIYPDLKPETRTARVRIELPNADLKLRTDMYANVVIAAGAGAGAVIAAPDSAVIDSGTRQVVLVAKGEGRYEPRAVKLGRRGEGMVEIREGLGEGEEVVTTATFLIDAESNLKAALQAFTPPQDATAPEQPK